MLLCSADVDYLLISGDDDGDQGGGGGGGGWPAAVRHQPRLVYVAARPATLRCVVVGGRPAPTIRVRLSRRPDSSAAADPGSSDRTAELRLRLTWRTEGERGLRLERRAAELASRGQFVVDVEDDGADVSCEASVDRLPPRLATATITVLCQ